MLLISVAAALEESALRKRKELDVDEELLLKIGRGDSDALARLVQTAGKAVYAYILSIIRNPEDADDIYQDTFLKIQTSAADYKPQGKPLAWIFTIARNFCMMRYRQDQKRAEMGYEELENMPALSRIEKKEDRMVLEAALGILTEEERQIVILHAVTGLKHREIARMLSMPLSTVLSKYRRSLTKLKAHLEGGGESWQ
ncbi:MAG TPA: RNA polymerase sigma factor [Candidatus Caccomorpha excrementavium]|nr:RNA polymerase sigma factor [Candidatus Caccomorpha excrementavium]